ncbi:hypothetical protein C8F01DRAFT_1147340 [Mycena amicta]|nr:hypothetical protein C8F01DRAFT_1147340 [Mycena amicta]
MPTHSPAILRRRLEEIDAEVASLQAKLAQLAAARRVVVEQLKRVVYPVLQLPVEITSKILLAYTQDVRIKIGYEQLKGPFVLASVCRHWREIAIRLHELWTRIRIDDKAEEVSFGSLKRHLRLCLERAGAHSGLNIYSVASTRILPFLIPSAGQWSTLVLSRPTDSDGPHWTGIRGQLQRLRRLVLYDCHEPINSAFDDAPMLEELELYDVDLSIVLMVSPPWAQFKSFTLYSNNLDEHECLRLLRQTPNLETLHLGFPQEADPQPHENLPELRLESLRTLSFTFGGALAIMKVLVVPALVDFTMDIYGGDDVVQRRRGEDEVCAVADMLLRSKCGEKMRSLTLRMNGEYTEPQSFSRLLEPIPFLDKLSVTEISWYNLDRLFAVLSRTRTDTSALTTRIRHLHLEPLARHIPYTEIASFVSAATTQANGQDEGTGLCRIEFHIPSEGRKEVLIPHLSQSGYGYVDPNEQEKVLSAVEKLRSMAASPGGPEISIHAQRNSFLIDSKTPPLHTLEDWRDA